MTPKDRLLYSQMLDTPAKRQLELARCARNIVHWVNTWCWTYSPWEANAGRNPHIPITLFPRQVEFLRWLEERERNQESGLCDKSREVGMSYLCCYFSIHRWLFRPGYSVGFGSRKEIYVDKKGSLDSLFGKIRVIIDSLPDWMRPEGYDAAKHATYMQIANPKNGATITGEAGDNIGRGGRKSIYFVDESAFLAHPELAERSLSQNTRVRIDVSTPNGNGNWFYKRRFSGLVPVFTFHWRDDPRKDDAWYENMKREFDPVTVAQEIDIDYSASIENVFIPSRWVRAAVDLNLPASGPLVVGLDIAEQGRDRTVMIPRCGPVVMNPIDWGDCTTHTTAYRVIEECDKLAVTTCNYDSVGVGTGPKGIWEARAQENLLGFVANPVNVGATPTETYWSDGKSSKEKFYNLKAELWWRLRARFENTYEHVVEGIPHEPHEMISIPNHSQLISELSIPKIIRLELGKIKVESKDQLRARGVKSPDFADALVLSEVGNVDPVKVTPLGRTDSPLIGMPRNAIEQRPLDDDDVRSTWESPDYLGMKF